MKKKAKKKTGKKLMTNLVTRLTGKKVIVRANVGGVHAGELVEYYPREHVVILSGAYRLWRTYTRDKSGSLSDIAANGLMPNGGHSIGARLENVLLENPQGFEFDLVTDDAWKTIEEWKN